MIRTPEEIMAGFIKAKQAFEKGIDTTAEYLMQAGRDRAKDRAEKVKKLRD